ncbi:MAG: chromosomal replication initiator protein DnaA [Actinobacteria bacterium]|nr:chromosomal replication initiator protein DnaA [Actinomycetota bacterium]MBL7123400.1 chromosomal replication initiator protein DnaA [Actinomycetota bacterium]
MADLENIWKNTLEDIKNKINLPTYKAWFEHITPLSLKKNCLTVSVGSSFAKEWLESRYSNLLSDSIKKVINGSCKIKIVATPDSLESTERYYDEYIGESIESSDFPNKKIKNSTFNTKYTFDTFIVGNSNRFACTASLAVSEKPGKTYNPLFIYGGVGLGKTHLLHAIGQYTIQLHPNKTVKYVSAERFLNDFINALRYKNIFAFKESYRNNDVLLVDDIHFLEDKEASQEEFFHTFNALHDTNRQIVLSSDRSPKNIATLEERLRSRFEWGLVTDITPPDLETRLAILKKYSEREKISVSDDILNLIAENITSNIRELEGSLTRVVAFASLTKSKPDLTIAKNILKDILPDDNEHKTSIQTIIKEVSKYFSIPINDILSAKRNKFISHARHLAMYLSRELTSSSLPRIGKSFGDRDHSTAIYAISKISDLIKTDKNVYVQIQEITNKIKKST